MPAIRNFFSHEDEDMVALVEQLPRSAYFLECDGQVFDGLDSVPNGKLIQIHFRMCGGKGGFGSLLRSFRIHKSHNQLMCRNLAGRRLADVKEEQRLKKWVETKAQRDKEKEKKEQEKIEKLKSGNKTKHEFNDPDYLRRRDTVLDEVEDAIEAGMKALEEKQAEPEVEEVQPEKPEAELEDQPTTSNGKRGANEEKESSSSDDSDLDLDELMSGGPLKKKPKRG